MSNIIIDSNLFLLLSVGLTDVALIPKHKKLSAYSIEDFQRLSSMISGFSSIILIPHVLAETSNLATCIYDSASRQILSKIREIVHRNGEFSISSLVGMDRGEYVRLGLTDAVILALLDGDRTLITADLNLHIAACQAGCISINYWHVAEFGS